MCLLNVWKILSIGSIFLINFSVGDDVEYFKREHSLLKPYQTSGISIPNWDFTGNVIVTNNYIRLTPDQRSKTGSLWNSIPCKSKNWLLKIHFRIHSNNKDLVGDGIAIWYAKHRLLQGPVFGSADYFHGLGVFIDTYANHNNVDNHEHPYISAMVNNGSLHYDHDKDGTHTELAGCAVVLPSHESDDSYISIRYEDNVLTVSTDLDGTDDWDRCLSVKGVRLPTGYYFGISATTGDLSENHDIISVKFLELEEPDTDKEDDDSNVGPAAAFFSPPRDHVEDDRPPPMSGTKFFLLMLCAVLGVSVCILGGVVALQNYNERSRKRLY